jgi:hypothetical protein
MVSFMNRSWSLYVALSIASIALASECTGLPQRAAFSQATLVFAGKLIKIEDVLFQAPLEKGTDKVPLAPSEPGDPRVFTFSVERAWKGHTAETIHVFGFGHPPMGSGYPFRLGAEYVVYTGEEVGKSREPLRRLSGGAPVYDLGMCILRVRADVARESRLLGRAVK